ncbi:MAG TPA: MFS transporter [Opitutus sp.]|nr:MFS transporter [Opitutus sp.]
MSEPTAPKRSRYESWGYMVSMGTMVAGFVSVEAITNNMVPITARHFTDSPLFIAFLVALNRFFGFLVQPYVAWKSDRIRTRWGRRRPFLILGLPGTCLALLLLGVMPFIFEGESRHALPTLMLLLVANVGLQFFQDVNWGSQEPLYADTFRFQVLGRAVAIRSYAIQFVYFFMNYFAMKWADTHEFIPYLCAAGLVLMSFVMVVWVIKERPFPPPENVVRYNPLAHLGLLFRNADYFKVSLIGAFGLMLPAAFYLFHPLFVTRTLGLTKSELGEALAVVPIVALIVSFPTGYLIDRYGPKWITAAGFFAVALVAWGIAYWVHDYTGLMIAMIGYGAAHVLVSLPMTPLVFQYASQQERGTVFGLIQFVRGFSAFVFSLLIGWIVQFSSSPDGTPIVPEDIKQAYQVAQRLEARETPVMRHFYSKLSPEAQAGLAEANREADHATVRRQLAQEFNAWLDDADLYTPEAFADEELSRHSRALVRDWPQEGDDLAALNRSLIENAFREEISRQPDYRLSYLLSVAICVAGGVVTLRTRKGAHAETLVDEQNAL